MMDPKSIGESPQHPEPTALSQNLGFFLSALGYSTIISRSFICDCFIMLGIGSWKLQKLSRISYFIESGSKSLIGFGTVANQRCYFFSSLSVKGISANLAGNFVKEQVPKVS